MQGVVVKDEPGAEYLWASSFNGSKPGYVYKKCVNGLGYYRDRAHTTYAGSVAEAQNHAKQTSGANHVPVGAASAVRVEVKQERLRVQIPLPGQVTKIHFSAPRSLEPYSRARAGANVCF